MKEASDFLGRCYPWLEALAGSDDLRQAGESLRKLQRGLTGERDLAGKSYFSDPSYLAAYLLYYWPVSFIQASRALEELRMRGVLPEVRSVLDIGAGPGPATFAARGFGAAASTLVDGSAAALSRAAALNDSLPDDMKIKMDCLNLDLEKNPALPQKSYDLIVACHSINELWKTEPDALARRTALLSRCLSLLSEKGILLVIEPAAISSSRPALELRNRLLNHDQEQGIRKYECVGPCTGSFRCPMPAASESRTCHSEWMWSPIQPVADLAKAAGLDRTSVKAAWFALRRAPPAEALPLAAETELGGRVVSEPMLNKAGRTRYVICTDSGLVSLSAKAGDAAAKAAGFFDLQRGYCIECTSLEKRQENGWGMLPGSAIRLNVRPPKD